MSATFVVPRRRRRCDSASRSPPPLPELHARGLLVALQAGLHAQHDEAERQALLAAGGRTRSSSAARGARGRCSVWPKGRGWGDAAPTPAPERGAPRGARTTSVISSTVMPASRISFDASAS